MSHLRGTQPQSRESWAGGTSQLPALPLLQHHTEPGEPQLLWDDETRPGSSSSAEPPAFLLPFLSLRVFKGKVSLPHHTEGGDTWARTPLCGDCPCSLLGTPFHQNMNPPKLWHSLTLPDTGRARIGRGRAGKKNERGRDESPVQTNCLRDTKIKLKRVVPAVPGIWQL